jgi:hypothetical protein
LWSWHILFLSDFGARSKQLGLMPHISTVLDFSATKLYY